MLPAAFAVQEQQPVRRTEENSQQDTGGLASLCAVLAEQRSEERPWLEKEDACSPRWAPKRTRLIPCPRSSSSQRRPKLHNRVSLAFPFGPRSRATKQKNQSDSCVSCHRVPAQQGLRGRPGPGPAVHGSTYLWYWACRSWNSSLMRSQESEVVNFSCCGR